MIMAKDLVWLLITQNKYKKFDIALKDSKGR
jgi:hypothetical protein